MDYLPVFMDLRGQPVVLVGGTEAAAQKARLLLRAGARLTVIAPAPGPALCELLAEPAVRQLARDFRPADLDGARIAVAATGDEAADRSVAQAADLRRLPVNIVDRPALCSFILPAFIDRSPVIVAVSTGGASPVLARLVRARIEAALPAGLGRLARLAASFRGEVQRRIPAFRRRRFWEDQLGGPVGALTAQGELAAAEAALAGALAASACDDPVCATGCRRLGACGAHAARGLVTIVGCGPGDPDRLTLEALQALQTADLVLADPAIPEALLDRGRRDAELCRLPRVAATAPLSEPGLLDHLHREVATGRQVLRLALGAPCPPAATARETTALGRAGLPWRLIPGLPLSDPVADRRPANLRAGAVAAHDLAA